MEFSILWWEKIQVPDGFVFPYWWDSALVEVQHMVLTDYAAREYVSIRNKKQRDVKSLRDSGLCYSRWYIKKKLKSRPRKEKNPYWVDARGEQMLSKWRGR